MPAHIRGNRPVLPRTRAQLSQGLQSRLRICMSREAERALGRNYSSARMKQAAIEAMTMVASMAVIGSIIQLRVNSSVASGETRPAEGGVNAGEPPGRLARAGDERAGETQAEAGEAGDRHAVDDRERPLHGLRRLLACAHLRPPPHDRRRGGRRLAASQRGFRRDRLGDDGFDLGVGRFDGRLHSIAASLRLARKRSSLMLEVLSPSTSAISLCDDPCA